MSVPKVAGLEVVATCKTACTGFAEFDAEAMMKKHGMQLPRCCPSDGLSSEWMAAATSANKSVLDYLDPP